MRAGGRWSGAGRPPWGSVGRCGRQNDAAGSCWRLRCGACTQARGPARGRRTQSPGLGGEGSQMEKIEAGASVRSGRQQGHQDGSGFLRGQLSWVVSLLESGVRERTSLRGGVQGCWFIGDGLSPGARHRLPQAIGPRAVWPSGERRNHSSDHCGSDRRVARHLQGGPAWTVAGGLGPPRGVLTGPGQQGGARDRQGVG